MDSAYRVQFMLQLLVGVRVNVVVTCSGHLVGELRQLEEKCCFVFLVRINATVRLCR